MITEVVFVSICDTKQEVIDELMGAKVIFEQSINGDHSFSDKVYLIPRVHGYKGKLSFLRIQEFA